MKAFGLLLSILCLLASIVILWIDYIGTFEGSGLLAQFEGTPREGWDYWVQKEYWQDVRSFSVFSALALGGFVLPAIAAFRGRRGAPASRPLSWLLFSISVLYSLVWSVGVVQWLGRGDFHPFLLIPVVLLLGSVFAIRTFFGQARFAIPTANGDCKKGWHR